MGELNKNELKQLEKRINHRFDDLERHLHDLPMHLEDKMKLIFQIEKEILRGERIKDRDKIINRIAVKLTVIGTFLSTIIALFTFFWGYKEKNSIN